MDYKNVIHGVLCYIFEKMGLLEKYWARAVPRNRALQITFDFPGRRVFNSSLANGEQRSSRQVQAIRSRFLHHEEHEEHEGVRERSA